MLRVSIKICIYRDELNSSTDRNAFYESGVN